MEGWIKLHRKVMDHWIFSDSHYFRGWIIILFTVNFEDKKVCINSQIIECKRGQSVLSLESWSDLFGHSKKSGSWTIQKVRTFFELLEKDLMITKENLIKTTRITVCNYDTYQDCQQPNNNQITTKQQPNNNQITIKQQPNNNQITTTKERKELKNDKKEKNIYSDNKNILLTENEFKKLKIEYPEYYLKAINYLSDYKIEKGYKTKSDYLTIKRWVIDAISKNGFEKKEEKSFNQQLLEKYNKEHGYE
jgi:hypothetical protein